MTTSFHVNVNDLQYILKQIQIAELHAGGMTTIQAIQEVYGVSAQEAALMPVGLRTVDGTDNNLLPGQEDFGAAQTPFPRLTDPVYTNEGDDSIVMGPPGTTPFTNTDYGQGGNVVDADPRTISNLIVDQTAANPAAIYAALEVLGMTGADATAAVNAITSACKAMLAAAALNGPANAELAEAGEKQLLASEAQKLASANDVAADLKVATLSTAADQADAAAAAASAAQTAVDALIAGLSTDPIAEDIADLFTAAKAAATTALMTASDVVTTLGSSDATVDALATANAAQDLLNALDALDGADGNDPIDAADLAAATAAAGAYKPVSEADGRAQDSADGLDAALGTAQTEATLTQAALDEATADLEAAQEAYDLASVNAGSYEQSLAHLANVLESYELEVGPEGGIHIQNISPDVGLSPSFNNLFTIFGQFFDHGLDLVTKGGNGTVYIPLEADDPLIAGADKVFGTDDDLPSHLRFMALTRATPDGTSHTNMTTAYVDQNQTYTSHASHQVFLRELVRVDIGEGTKAYSTGRLLDGDMPGTIGTWADVKQQALEVLGIKLEDHDVHRVPLLATDQYGNLILGPNGYAQMVMEPDAEHAEPWLKEGTAEGIGTQGSMAAGPAFLDDIAHHAAPGFYDSNGDRIPDTPQRPDEDLPDGNDATDDTIIDDRNPQTYDDEMLDAHFITGDGRGNENIGLSAVHGVFHAEHNRILEVNKHTIIESGDLAFINEWLLVDVTELPTPADVDNLVWDGARLFQAARFSTEMQYQHMVFEEFARRIQPAVDPFVFTNTVDIDPSIVAEFAHAVYRFGHSMLTDTVDRIDNDLNPVLQDGEQLSLIEAFLNPQAYTDTAANFDDIQAAILRGLSADVGSEIDEFIVPALRSNLLGLPLDLAALNIARARETGVPSLNETRAQLYNDFGIADLKPYESWSDFAQHLKNPISLINFVAAYGNHQSIEGVDTLEAKRAAATLLVLGDTDLDGDGTIEANEMAPDDRMDFLDARGAYAAGQPIDGGAPRERGGLDNVDLWIGGLAEKVNEFGGMLGSTFNFIFEYQMEQLQNGDRFYYLSRVQGLNLLDSLEANTFADIMMRNSSLGDQYAPHIHAHAFLTPDMILELDRGIKQRDYSGTDNFGNDLPGLDPTWDDPLLQAIDPKVVRDYTGSTKVDGNHDVGGKLVFRGGEHVVLGGTEGNDTLISDIGDDALWGDGGNDYISTGQGADQAFGGDGDDIILNPFGDDFLRGERGNDVISAARGLNILFGGQGHDAILIGQDASEAFAGEGDDFVLGGSGADFLLGNEGNDWIEGGEGFDTIAGENSELFFNSTIVGHDVAWGQGNEQDYDLESGDDIAFSGPSVQRFEGMFGFDWAIAKFDVAGVDWDANVPIFTSVPADILRDRFDLMEAFSGWKYGDVIRGDNRGSVGGGGLDPDTAFDDHVLDRAGLERIDGLKDWFGDLRDTLADLAPESFVDPEVMFRDGNILLGGGGSDILQGRGGFDLLDGDAWLNVRIKVMIGGVEYSAESLNSSTMAAGPYAGKLFMVNTTTVNGQEVKSVDFSTAAFGGRSLMSLLLDRTVNPGNMSIVRELVQDSTPGAVDTALFSGNLNDYIIEGRGQSILNDAGESVIQSAFDVNGDGFISVTDTLTTRGAIFDDTDFLKNMERLQFADQIVDLTKPIGVVLNANLSLRPGELPGATALPGAGATIGQITSDRGTGGTFELRPGSSPAVLVSSTGVVTLASALGQNQTYTLNLRLTAPGESGAIEDETIVLRTGTGAANTIQATAADEVIYALGGNDNVTGAGGDDVLYGQAGADLLIGGAGADILVGGTGGDNIQGGEGSDTIYFAWGDGTDTVDGGADADALQYQGNASANSVSAIWTGTSLLSMTGLSSITGVESIRLDLGDGVDQLSYSRSAEDVVVDLRAGAASGFASILGIENVTGGDGEDILRGDSQANSLLGGAGGDEFLATVDDLRDVYNGGTGVDTIGFSEYTTGLSIDLGSNTAVVVGSGSAAATSDTVSSVENIVGGLGNDTLLGNQGTNELTGSDGNDMVNGRAGNDVLFGGAGDDVLIGDTGADRLTGDDGDDVFVFATLSASTLTASDTIVDFQGAGAAGGDVIEIDALTGATFTFIGTEAFTRNNPNQVRYAVEGVNTAVYVNTDNDVAAELRLLINGQVSLIESDFQL